MKYALPWQRDERIQLKTMFRVICGVEYSPQPNRPRCVVWYQEPYHGSALWVFNLIHNYGHSPSEQEARQIIDQDLVWRDIRLIDDPKLINLL